MEKPRVEWMNYHHLYYFWIIVREGGVARAARSLGLTHSTLSAQLRTMEEFFGLPLFERRGRRLVLTPFGEEAASYASDIFRLGQELVDVARGRATRGREVLRVGVVSTLPKTLTHRLLDPALEALGSGDVQVRQDALARLVDSLVSGRLDMILSDDVPAGSPLTRGHAHFLGESEILLYASSSLAKKLRRRFPDSLDGMPFVFPSAVSGLRRRLDGWFAKRGISVSIRAELDDAGLLRVFGGAGRGIFPVRAALRAEVEDLHDVELVGACEGLREPYFALSTERRIKHPAVAALVRSARERLHARTS
ncbi:LysR family transcriptional regulator [Polyangium spumosum]|uniref:LysR family transcriptional regulator n=1 Tax=Polyangium spumosum TaxID=889282 RepID=A0A6N7PXH9_9BACT|nr:LysR family transcriptional regulator [Polyangium spumosum]MRG96942.1 LysR family transcriptional regulator [Polyangium spumosum]